MPKCHRAEAAPFEVVWKLRPISFRQCPPAADPGEEPDNREPQHAEK